MCATSFGWRHLVNAYGVKAGWFIPFVDKRVGGMQVKLCDLSNWSRDALEVVHNDAIYKSAFTLLYLLGLGIKTKIRMAVSKTRFLSRLRSRRQTFARIWFRLTHNWFKLRSGDVWTSCMHFAVSDFVRSLSTFHARTIMHTSQYSFISVYYPRRHNRRRGRAFSRVCLSVCLSVCPSFNRKTVLAINTKLELDTHIFYSSRSECIAQRSNGQGSRSHGYDNRHGIRLLVTMARIPHTGTYTPLCYLRPLPAWVCMSIWLPMFSSCSISCHFVGDL